MNFKNALLAFKPVTLEDRSTLLPYLEKFAPPDCYYNFALFVLWENCPVEFAVLDQVLFLRSRGFENGNFFYMQPLGDFDSEMDGVAGNARLCSAMQLMKRDAAARGEVFCMRWVSREFKERLEKCVEESGVAPLLAYNDRSMCNYLYKSENLASLAGRRLQPKRNHVHQFMREFPDYEARPLTKGDETAALALFDSWMQSHVQSLESPDSLHDNFKYERILLQKAFRYFDELEIEGVILSVPEAGAMKPVAFTFGSANSREVFCTHIEKADPRYGNAFAMVNRAFAEQIRGRYPLINREEDLGIENLRRAKLSYHPERIEDSWILAEAGSELHKVWKLWQQEFHDSDEFLISYLLPYSSSGSRVLELEGEKLQAMAHVHYFTTSLGLAGYVYGVAVDSALQGRGLGTKVVERALDRIRARGAKMAWVIQANLGFNAWENRLGFFAPDMSVDKLWFGDAYFQDAFGSDCPEHRALVRAFDADTEEALRQVKGAFEMKFLQ